MTGTQHRCMRPIKEKVVCEEFKVKASSYRFGRMAAVMY